MNRLWNKLFSIDPRSLAAFRIVLAGVLLADLAIRATALVAFYTDSGAVPRSLLPTGQFPSLHALAGSVAWEAFLFTLAALAALGLLVGWRTRMATIVSWCLLASLHARNPLVINSGDSLLRMMLFWGMFLPLGRVWSVDARRYSPRPANFAPELSVASGCLLLQTCLMYWGSAYAKYNEVWRDGEALYYTFSIDSYARPLATYLLQYPAVLGFLSVATLVVEAVGPMLAFIPWRTKVWRLLVIAAFIGLHLSIELTLTVGLFSYVSLLAWIPFLPDIFWNKLAGPLPVVKQTGVESSESARGVWRAVAKKVAALACLLAMMFILLYCYSATQLPGSQSGWLKSIAQWAPRVMLTQNWGMFGRPSRFDGWCVAAARLQDGQTVDLLRGGASLDWEKPDRVSKLHPNHRWRKYFSNLHADKNAHYRPDLCRYLAHRWNAHQDASRRALWVDLYLVKEWTPQPGESPELQRVLLHRERVAALGAFEEAALEKEKAPASADERNALELPPGL